MQRKLAAILSADVVAYSRMMERDEAETLERLKANRLAIFQPLVEAHQGRLFKLMGDGALVEFASAVAAVECARKIQAATAQAEPDLPDDARIRYRIGVNLGEVIVEGDDIYGEGVNVAARLQALAEPGGVTLSRLVRDQVAGKVAADFNDLGEHSVKNIERPVHVFALRGGAKTTAATAPATERARLGICVLPFANMSGDPEQEYFSDGVTEDIITDLSKVSSLAVVSRSTAFTFKGKAVDIGQIARQLKVSHVLEGSVRKSGKRVRITAQLIEGAGDSHVWGERYDRDLDDIFALQDEISRAIVAALRVRLLPSERKAIEQRSTTNSDAYKIYLMARQYHVTASARHRELIIRLCKRALEIDPNYARAWALLAISQSNLRLFTGGAVDSGLAAAERALTLDPNLGEGHAAKGRVLSELGRYEEAWKEHQTALRLEPESYDVNTAAARCAIGLRAWDEAIRLLEAAASIAEADVWALGIAVQCYEAKDDLEGAKSAARRCLARAEKIIAVEPDHGTALGFGVTALATLGDAERAKEWTERGLLLDPDDMNLKYNLACAMVTLREFDAAVELLRPVFAIFQRENLIWFAKDNSLDAIRDDPRIKQMVADAEARCARAAATASNVRQP